MYVAERSSKERKAEKQASQNEKSPPSYQRLHAGLESGLHLWWGMGVNVTDKLNTGLDTRARPQTTTLDQRQPHQK